MESLTDNMSNLESDYKFENKEEFEILIISLYIESYDYNNPGYVTKLVGEILIKL